MSDTSGSPADAGNLQSTSGGSDFDGIVLQDVSGDQVQLYTPDEPATQAEGAGDPIAVEQSQAPLANTVAAPVQVAPQPTADPVLAQVATALQQLAQIQQAQAQAALPPPEPPQQPLSERFEQDRAFREQVMVEYGFDPKSPRDILAMKATLDSIDLRAQIQQERAAREQFINQYQSQMRGYQVQGAFNQAVQGFEALPQETLQTLQQTAIALAEQGMPYDQAVQTAIAPFQALFRAKGATPPAALAQQPQQPRRPIDMLAARVAATRSNANSTRSLLGPNGRPEKGAITRALEAMEGYKGWG